MSSPNINQKLNIKQSQDYDDQLDPTQAENVGGNGETDLNHLRTMVRLISGETVWNKIPTKTLQQVATGVNSKKLVFYWSSFVDITVPLTQNWVFLGTLGQPPSEDVAFNPNTIGAVVAVLPGQVGMTHHLTTAANDGNVLDIREAATNQQLLTSTGQPIYGLLQVDNTSVDDEPFTIFGPNSAQISFVYRDTSTESLVAVPVADIGNKVIEYAYQRRANFEDVPENFAIAIRGGFTKAPAPATQEDTFTPAFAGETVFTLSQAPLVGGDLDLYVNGIKADDATEFTVSGITLTWLDFEYLLDVTDTLFVRYSV